MSLRFLFTDRANDAGALARLVARSAEVPREIEERAKEIVGDVRARGDAAVRDWTSRLEGRELNALELSEEEWERQAASVRPPVRAALEHATDRIRRFHERWRESSWELDEPGIRLGLRVEPLARVGLYVPGGTARYPSTVLMTAIPARAAGVPEIVMTTPGPSPETLLAARLAGVHRVFLLGGAQAIGALAYGTASVARVDKIVGPGNLYVAAAKRLVFGDCDIDSIAGPSEILILADDTADPRYLAADLLSQAEHDTAAYPILVTPSEKLAQAVSKEITTQVATLPRRAIAEAALAAQGVAVIAKSLDEAIDFANRFAAEHVEIVTIDPRAVLPRIRTAGACFLGPFSPEAVGDYIAGPNHVLPTAGAARYASPLGCWDFVRRSTVIDYSAEALAAQAADIGLLTEVEGLEAHRRAVAIRGGQT